MTTLILYEGTLLPLFTHSSVFAPGRYTCICTAGAEWLSVDDCEIIGQGYPHEKGKGQSLVLISTSVRV